MAEGGWGVGYGSKKGENSEKKNLGRSRPAEIDSKKAKVNLANKNGNEKAKERQSPHDKWAVGKRNRRD